MNTQEKIRNYILQHYPSLQEKGLGDNDSLVGVLDSLAVLGLIGYIEPEFSIELGPSDLNDENFGTVTAVTHMIERLSAARR